MPGHYRRLVAAGHRTSGHWTPQNAERHTKRCVSLFGDADSNGICITCGQVLSNVRETLEEGELEPQIY